MKCEKCGSEIDRISIRVFMRDVSDAEDFGEVGSIKNG